jgi:tetratricopeptide (TPR) repeat protein
MLCSQRGNTKIMARKNEVDGNTSLSAEDSAQVERLLALAHEIAQNLYAAKNQEEAEAALATIDNLQDTAQMALVKGLAKVRHSDAADILKAINELASNKNIRKEARRSLIRLEEAKVYPQWTSPVERTPAIQLPSQQPPRFWRGYVTRSREEGEVQLILCWEEGLDYNDVRMLTFLIDFWEQGLKDFLLEEHLSKRAVESRLQKMREQLPDITITDCTLAEGRRLIEEALAVNKWRGTASHKEYRKYLPTVNQLILNAQDVGEDRGLSFINPNLEPDEVTAIFIGAWSLGDYGLTYDLLTSDSSIRDDLDRDEWIERRRNWAKEAQPSRFEMTFIREREVSTPAVWLPFAGSRGSSTRREIEVGWSLEVSETQLSGTLKEMPMGTIVYKETGRHWFWTSYTLAKEDGRWRIQKMNDDGANAQGLSINELQNRVKEQTDRVNEIMQTHNSSGADAQQFTEEIVWRMVKSMHYDDALLIHLPLDRTIYGDAYSRAMSLGALERAIVYLDRLAHRFAEQKGEMLRQLALTQEALSEHFGQIGMREREQQFSQFAEQAARESLGAQDEAGGHVVLAELLMQRGTREALTDAEKHLNQAREMVVNVAQEAAIEDALATIAIRREQYQAALGYYQHIAELNQNTEDLWLKMAYVQRRIGQPEAARATYERAIKAQPDDFRPYAELGSLYIDEEKITLARETLERGLQAIPNSAHLLALLASVYIASGDMRRAESTLERAEQIEPNLDMVQAVREQLNRLSRTK